MAAISFGSSFHARAALCRRKSAGGFFLSSFDGGGSEKGKRDTEEGIPRGQRVGNEK